jgi:HEAT repeat protein
MRKRKTIASLASLQLLLCCFVFVSFQQSVCAQDNRAATPIQAEIEKQRQRLGSSDVEERRDALMKLDAMRRPEASRVALPSLSDESPIIRAVAAKAVLSLNANESVPALLPLLNDKDEFVRREAVYALGLTHSRNATQRLTEVLLNDKEDGVRSAAAVALGEIGDEGAVVALASVIAPELSAPGKKAKKVEKNSFVLRAAARSLGQIRSRAGTQALISALSNEKYPDDVHREAALSLGLLGDPSAVPALKSAAASSDPFLARTAVESLKKLTP